MPLNPLTLAWLPYEVVYFMPHADELQAHQLKIEALSPAHARDIACDRVAEETDGKGVVAHVTGVNQ